MVQSPKYLRILSCDLNSSTLRLQRIDVPHRRKYLRRHSRTQIFRWGPECSVGILRDGPPGRRRGPTGDLLREEGHPPPPQVDAQYVRITGIAQFRSL